MLTFRFTGKCGIMEVPEKLVSGTIGKQVLFHFSPDWEELKKVAVFMALDGSSHAVCSVEVTQEQLTIPASLLENPEHTLYVQVQGFSPDGAEVINTGRVKGPRILPGIDPGELPEIDGKNPVWLDVLNQMGNLEELETQNKTTLISAINELALDKGKPGPSAYDLALQEGFQGSLPQWLDSLSGKSAYDYALEAGYIGSEEDFSATLLRSKEVLCVHLQSVDSGGYHASTSYMDIAHAHATGMLVLLKYGTHITHILAGTPTENSFLFEPLLHSVPGIHGYMVDIQDNWSDVPVHQDQILVFNVSDGAQVAAAIASGKPVYCLLDDLYHLPLIDCREDGNIAVFGGCYDDKIITCEFRYGGWTVKAEKIGSDVYALMTKTISGTSSDSQIPTARAVHQAIAQAVPAITQEAGQSETLVMSQKAVTDLVAAALEESSKTEYETVDSVEQMTDTSKSYVLESTGTIWTYGEVTVTKEPENKLVASKVTLNSRMSGSSGSVSAATGSNGSFVTDYIAVTDYASATPFNVRLNWELQESSENKVVFFNASKTRIGNTVLAGISIANGQTVVDIKTPNATGATMPTESDVAYIRLQLFVKPSGTALVSSDLDGLTITFDYEKGTITENRWYDTGMTPDTAGNGNYVGLLVKINENAADIAGVSTRVTALEAGSDTLTVPPFWQDAVDACISKIKALQVGKNCVTFPFFSDNHQRNGYAGVLIAKVMQECHIPYCFYGGDSISSGTIADEATMVEQDKAFDTIMSYIPNGRFCRAVGNHDGYWYDGSSGHTYNRNQVYELFLREESVAQNKHFGFDGTYYYVDDLASKVRFIVLNTNGGEVDILQLAWLQDTALSLPENDWEVVLISHQPISNHYHSNINNVTEFVDTITQSGADIIGCFSGHIHRDRIYTGIAVNTTDDSVGAELPFKQVTITSDHTAISYDDTTKHAVANDDQSHAIDFVTINKSARTVNLTRLGIGGDRSYSY